MTEELKQDMLHTIDTKVRYDNLFWWFEENQFEHKYDLPKKTSLVLEFKNWVENIDSDELTERLGFFADYKDTDDAEKAAEQARIEIQNGINMWMED